MTLVTIYLCQVSSLATTSTIMFILSICVVGDDNYFELADPKSSHLNQINSTWWWCYYYFHSGFFTIFYLLHSSFTTTELQGSCYIYSCFLLESRFIFYLPIYTIFSLYMMYTSILSVLFSTVHSVAKSREGVVRGIPVCTYERTVHTFIPYIALNSLIERPRSLVREIYGSPHIPY